MLADNAPGHNHGGQWTCITGYNFMPVDPEENFKYQPVEELKIRKPRVDIPKTPPGYLTIAEYAKLDGDSRGAVYHWIEKGEIDAIFHEKHWFIREGAVTTSGRKVGKRAKPKANRVIY